MSAAWYDPRIARGMVRQLTRWHQQLKTGEKAIGWKVGFGTPESMERLKLTAPLVGYLTDESVARSGETVAIAQWSKPIAEPEVAVYLGKDLAGGASREAAMAAIAGLGPAIELVDLDAPPEDVASILSGNIYQRRVLFGPRDNSRAGCRLDGLTATVVRNGNELATTSELQALTGDCVDNVRHVADMLAAFGERLAAGQVVITGSITAPLFLEPQQDIEFKLDPVGSVSVRLA